jgi:hypothetical protein
VEKTWCAIIEFSHDGDSFPSGPKPAAITGTKFMPLKRPFGVTLLLWLVLSLSVWGALRLSAALRWWDVLYEKGARLSPLYLSITGAGWVVGGAVLLLGIWMGRRWVYLAVPASVFVWLAGYWVERLFFQAPRANLPFMIAASAVLLMVTLLSTFNRKTKDFLIRSEEHEQPKEHSTPA